MTAAPRLSRISSMKVMITGITGNFGFAVYRLLRERKDLELCAGTRNPERVDFLLEDPAVEARMFDFMDPSTWAGALEGVDTLVLVRPPSLAKVKKYIFPFIDVCKTKGLRHIIFLSIQGAESRRLLPHHKIENYIRRSGIGYTFLRPGFFMENLITTHRDEIRYSSELIIPAGEGRTSFIAVEDIAAAAQRCIGRPEHLNQAYELTGDEAWSYREVAELLSEVLGRTVSYRAPGVLTFLRYRRSMGESLGYILVMIRIYRNVRRGGAECRTDTLQRVFDIPPKRLKEFIREKAGIFAP